MTEQKSKKRKDVRLDLGNVNKDNVKMLKIINDSVFPFICSGAYYNHVLRANPELTKLAYYNDIVVGGISACLELLSKSNLPCKEPHHRLCIKTIAVLSPYRRLGLGTLMMLHMLEVARQIETIDYVYLHVPVGNKHAIEFFSRLGFSTASVVEAYYTNLAPNEAFCNSTSDSRHTRKKR